MLAGHQGRNERLARRKIERRGPGRQTRDEVDGPDGGQPGKRQRGQRRRQRREHDLRREQELPAVERSIESLFREVLRLGGTLSGEHGIGLAKSQYLPIEHSEELIALQRDLKRVFDPKGLLNPGKIFPQVGHRAC